MERRPCGPGSEVECCSCKPLDDQGKLRKLKEGQGRLRTINKYWEKSRNTKDAQKKIKDRWLILEAVRHTRWDPL